MNAALPLHELHRDLDASLRSFQGVDAPASYGDETTEARALRQAAGLIDRSWHDRLRLTGADRQRFLGGLVTCDVNGLEAGQGTYGFVTDIKGRVLADLVALADADTLTLDVPPGTGPPVTEHLLKYKIIDRVEVAAVARPVTVTVCGPAAEAALAAAIPAALPADGWAHIAVELAGLGARVVRDSGFGDLPAWTLWLDCDAGDGTGGAQQTVAALLEAGRPHGLVPVGWRAAEVLRIEQGRPRFGQDFDHGNFPQETGIDEAVSYTKGCYLGQEVVARIHYRGGVQRRLVGLRFAEPAADATGAELRLDGRPVGEVTSWTRSDTLGAIGLAIVHRRAEDGATVELDATNSDGGTAVIRPIGGS